MGGDEHLAMAVLHEEAFEHEDNEVVMHRSVKLIGIDKRIFLGGFKDSGLHTDCTTSTIALYE